MELSRKSSSHSDEYRRKEYEAAERIFNEDYDDKSSSESEPEKSKKKEIKHKHKSSHQHEYDDEEYEKKQKRKKKEREEEEEEELKKKRKDKKKKEKYGSGDEDLEDRYKKSKDRRKSPPRKRRSRSRNNDPSPKRKRSKSRNNEKSPRKKRSRSKNEDRTPRRRRSRSKNTRSPRKRRSRSRSEEKISPKRYLPSPTRRSKSTEKLPELTLEERDARTVFCMQLSPRLKSSDLRDFFGKLGKIRDVRLITDNRSRRSKGIAYIEFFEVDSVPKALQLNGKKLLGVPIIIQLSHGERNRSGIPITAATGKPGEGGPMKLYMGSLHYNISEEMLRSIFEPFGPLDELKLMKDHVTGKSAGYGFLQFRRAEDGKRALDQLNGFEIAGRPMKLSSIIPEYQMPTPASSLFDADEVDQVGFGMSATSRLQLMAKLAEGTGLQIPKAAATILKSNIHASSAIAAGNVPGVVPSMATQCFLLSNMFASGGVKDLNWEKELRDEVLEECNKHGGVLHIHIERTSPQGHIYVKCPSIAAAMASVNTLHGRFFDGRQITAAYVPLPNYHSLFPESARTSKFLMPSHATKSSLPYSFN